MLNLDHLPWDWNSSLAALRALQLFLGAVSATTPTTVYTVPAGKRTIVKSVTVQNTTGASKDVQLRVSGTGTIYHWNLTAYGTAGDRAVQNFWIVLNPGDVLQFQVSVTGQIDVSVSGSLHTI